MNTPGVFPHMSNLKRHRYPIHAAAVFWVAILVGSTIAARAAGRERDGTWQNSRGGSGSWSQQVERTPGQSSRELGWTGQRGTGSKVTARAWDRGAGTWQRQTTTTGAGGKQAMSSVTGTKTEAGHSVEGSRTGFAGGTQVGTRTVTKLEDGSRQAEGHYSTSSDRQLDTQSIGTKTSTGYARDGSYSTGGGGSGTFSSSVTKDDDSVTKNKQLTTDSGKTYSKDVTTTHEDGTATRTVTLTGPDGKTQTHSGSATVNK